MKIKVSEIFYSIEGEGIFIGSPQIFLRLGTCNLRCRWCDTKYAWKEYKELAIDKVLKTILSFRINRLSITGGEPLLQEQNLIYIIKQLKNKGFWININTNATIFSEAIFNLVDFITLDFKLPSSKMNSSIKVLNLVYNKFMNKTQFKFVISDREDFEYSKYIIINFLQDAKNIIFQPEFSNFYFIRELIDLVKLNRLSVRVIIQQHKFIYKDKERGI